MKQTLPKPYCILIRQAADSGSGAARRPDRVAAEATSYFFLAFVLLETPQRAPVWIAN